MSLHHLLQRNSYGCSSASGNIECTTTYTDYDMPEFCRANCSAMVAAANCVGQANPTQVGKPQANIYPDISNPSNITVNNATTNCYRTINCPKLGEQVDCLQCLLDKARNPKKSKQEIAQIINATNTDFAQYGSYCESIGAKAGSYTPLRDNSAKVAAATSSLLLALGVAAASLL